MPIDASGKNTEIEQMIIRARAEYPLLWHHLITEWKRTDLEDAAWLTYSANYLLRTAGVRWAIDPFSLFSRIGGGKQPDFVHDLDALQLVILTHSHRDHLDLNLLSAIRSLPITWIIPEFLVDTISNSVPLPAERILIPKAGTAIHFGKLTLHPFDGLHFHEGNGVPELGYLVEFNGNRWLFPGDTRRYDSKYISRFAEVTGVFAHCWLGKACALLDSPPFLQEFCHFYFASKPQRIIISHLQEMGRGAEDFWDTSHCQRISKVCQEIAPSVTVNFALMGQKVLL